MKTILLLLIIASSLVLSTGFAAAIQIIPEEITLQASRGETYEIPITIINNNNHEIKAIALNKSHTISVKSRKTILLKHTVSNETANGIKTVLIPIEISAMNKTGTIIISNGKIIKLHFNVTGKEVINATIKDIITYPCETGSRCIAKIRIISRSNVIIDTAIKIISHDKNKTIAEKKTTLYPHKTVEISFDISEIDKFSAPDKTNRTYYAKVVAMDKKSEKNLSKKQFTIEIFPRYTFSKNFSITSTSATKIQDGSILIKTHIKNNGILPTETKSISEIYLNGSLMIISESSSRTVLPNSTATLRSTFEPTIKGKYEIMTIVEYDGKETDPVNTSIQIVAGKDDNRSVNNIGSAILLLFLIILLIMTYKRINTKK